MAQNSDQVRVALAGRIVVADLDTPDITSRADLDKLVADGTGADLGFTTEDGVSFSFSKDTEELAGWGGESLEPLRVLVTSSPKQCEFTLRQLSAATWTASLGGEITKVGDLYKWEPDDAALLTKRVYVEFRDGDIFYIFGFRRAQQTAEAEFSLVRNDAVNLPNSWRALAPGGETKAMFVLTNDPAFAEVAVATDTPATTPATGGASTGGTDTSTGTGGTGTGTPATGGTGTDTGTDTP